MSDYHADVAVVGAGPVGQLLAAFLGQQGHQVLVLERWPTAYPLPRAVTYDDEVARMLFAAGVGPRIVERSQVCDTYEWRNSQGQTLLRFDWTTPGEAGHPRSNMFSQPDLEAVLAERLTELPTVRIERGQEVVDLIVSDPDQVEMITLDSAGARRRWTAGYVVGADGSASFVRSKMSTDVRDLGFAYDWLIVDVLLHEERTFHPVNLQICDPARPTTVISGGPGRRRWEFMRLPGEIKDELNTLEAAWRLLAPFDVHPGNATLERHAVYTFQARWAQTWRDGRLLLAGDAAHLMPPFAGQGMCSGMRDARNLAWKLDLVLRGNSADELLDSYTSERSAHVQHAVHTSVALGRVICVLDHELAAQRDASMLAAGGDPARVLPPIPLPILGAGVRCDGEGAGQVTGQGLVRHRGRVGLFDDVVGTGFVVVADFPPNEVLRPEQVKFLAEIGAHVVHIVPDESDVDGDSADAVVDLGGHYLMRWATIGLRAEVIRPDTYLFGSVNSAAELSAMIDLLRDRLQLRSTAGSAS